MSKENTVRENIEFLLMMYERELKEENDLETEELYKTFIVELKTALMGR